MKTKQPTCLIEMPDGKLILGKMCSDGLAFIFGGDIVPYLNAAFPTKDMSGWFFNESRDRYIAEILGYDEYLINPQFIWRHTAAYTVEE